MFFKKKKPKRLYMPTKSKWYRKPRKKPVKKMGPRRAVFSKGMKTGFSRFFKDAIAYIIIGALFIGILGFFLFSNKFSIAKIEVARSDIYVDNAGVAQLLNDYKGQSIFSFSKNEAKALIEEAYPEFSDVQIKRLLPNTIKVDVVTYDIVANVRAFYTLPNAEESIHLNDEPDEDSEENEVAPISRQEITPIEQKALLNSIGQALIGREENPNLVTITIDGLTQPIEDKQFVIEPEHMQFINESVRYVVNTEKMEIKEIIYFPIAHEVHLVTQDDLTLWLISKKDYKSQLNRFSTIYNLAEMQDEDIAYFDLRVNEKIIYCPRGKQCDK